MKAFAVPSTGAVDATPSISAECLMPYTEQLSWYLLTLYRDANAVGSQIVLADSTEYVGDTEFLTMLTNIKNNISNLANQTRDRGNEIEAAILSVGEDIEISATLMGEVRDFLEQMSKDYGMFVDDTDPQNVIDGITDVVTFGSNRAAEIGSWIAAAATALDIGEEIPALPAIAAVAAVVPAKWALVAKIALAVVPQLLLSYVKGKLESPRIKVEIDTDGIVEAIEGVTDAIEAGTLNSSGEPFLGAVTAAQDVVIDLVSSNDQRIRIFPYWNCADVS